MIRSGRWILSMVALALASTAVAADAPPVREWIISTPAVGVGYGQSDGGLVAADLDGDGTPELIGASNEYWQVLAHDGAGGYTQRWVQPIPGAFVSIYVPRLRVAQVDGDAALEILIARESHVDVYDGVTFRLEHSVNAGRSELTAFDVADVDLDGRLEVVAIDNSSGPGPRRWLEIRDFLTGAQERLIPEVGGYDLAIGNVDNDGALEIVTAFGDTGAVIDGVSGAIEWRQSFGEYVRVADVDADGRKEIVAAWSTHSVAVFDADTRTQKFERPARTIAALHVDDVTGDGSIEILYAERGVVFVLDASGAVAGTFPLSHERAVSLTSGDVDDDGVREVIWGGSTPEEGLVLRVHRIAASGAEWYSLDESGFYRGVVADVDADGQREVVYTASPAGPRDARWLVRDLATQALEFRGSVEPFDPWSSDVVQIETIHVANIDDDPQLEVLIATRRGERGWLICFDGLTHVEQWRAYAGEGLRFVSIATGDVDNDGNLEVVAGSGWLTDSAPGVYLHVFDAASGAPEWQSPSLGAVGAQLRPVRIANIDADAQPEVLVGISGTLLGIDVVQESPQLQTTDIGLSALDAVDVDEDGRAEIFAATGTGDVLRIDPATGFVVETSSYGIGGISALRTVDVTGDGVLDRVLTAQNRVFVTSRTSNAVLWRSPVLGNLVGGNDALQAGDVDGDGRPEVVIGAANELIGLELPDTVPPTVALTAPADAATVSGVVVVQATAADARGVAGVQLYVDGAAFGSEDTTAPYTIDWDTTTASAGTHTLTAVARDAAGNQTTSAPVTVTVVHVPKAPRGLRAFGGDDQVTVSWEASPGATSYTLRRATSRGGPYVDVLTASPALSFVDSAPNGQTYYYKVFATNVAGASLDAGPAWATPPTLLPIGHTVKDFNGDGYTDLVWRHTNGTSGLWLMGGALGTEKQSVVMLPATGSAWDMVGFGDFTGDGAVDIVLQNRTTGAAGIWVMNGTTFDHAVALPNPGANWQVMGVGHFDANGTPDIVLRNRVNGVTGVWFMNGLTSSGASVIAGESGTNWEIVGICDFDRDDDADIVWRNRQTGVTGIWYMNGATFEHAAALPQQDTTPEWLIVDIADFDRDGGGSPDFLWRQRHDGRNGVWFMDGANRTGIGLVENVGDVAWEVKN